MNGNPRIIELLDFRKYSGTTSFYTNAEFNAMLGQAERLVIHAVVTESSGTSPTVTVVLEDSSDNENFDDVVTLINGVSLSSTPLTERAATTSSQVYGRFVRLKVTLGGTSPTATMTIRASLKSA